MARLTCCLAVMLFVRAPLLADQYWIAYEGNEFPETQGWTRVNHSSPAKRWIEGGKLFIDSRPPGGIYDYYKMVFNGNLNPQPGETFVMRWRLKVDEVFGFADPVIGVTSDDLYGAGFNFDEDCVRNAYAPGVLATFQAGIFHEYDFRSSDMRTYELYIDGRLAATSVFYEVFGPPRVGWGDAMTNWSLAQWDYVRFGVIPEPGTGLLFAFGLALRRGDRT